MLTKENSVAVFFRFVKSFCHYKSLSFVAKVKTQLHIGDKPLFLLENFLSELQQYQIFGGEISEFADESCGIPQGSSL